MKTGVYFFLTCLHSPKLIHRGSILIRSLESYGHKPIVKISKISKSVFLILSCQLNTNIARILKLLHLVHYLEMWELHFVILYIPYFKANYDLEHECILNIWGNTKQVINSKDVQ